MNTEILGRVLQRSDTLRCEGAWSPLGAVRNCRRLPEDSSRVTNGLVGEFPDEALEDSGVVRHDNNGDLQLVPRLGTGSGVLIPLRRELEAVPFDVITDTGCLNEEASAVLAGLEDHWLKAKLAAAGHRLLIATSIHDLVILRRLSLPAVLGVEVDRLNCEQVNGLAARFGWSSGCQAAVNGSRVGQQTARRNRSQRADLTIPEVDVVFVGWSLSEIDLRERSELSTTVLFVSELAHFYRFDKSNVGVWQPDAEDLQGLDVGIRMRDCAAIRRLMLESLDHSTFQLTKYVNELDEEPKDFFTARADLARTLADNGDGRADPERVAKAYRVFAAAVDEQVYEPSVIQALTSFDPAARGMNLVVAELSRKLILQGPSIQESYGKRTIDDEGEGTGLLRKKSTDDFLQLANTLVKAYRETKR